MEESRVDPIALFPEEMRQDAHDLTYLGYISTQVDFCGHQFSMETLRPYLKYTIAQVFEPWRNTIKEPDVWGAIHVATALTSIDGNGAFCPPLNDDPKVFVQGRLFWLTGPQGYWQPTIDYLFGEYVKIEQRAAEVIGEAHRLAQRSRDTLLPSPGSWTVPAPSNESTDGDTPPTDPSS